MNATRIVARVIYPTSFPLADAFLDVVATIIFGSLADHMWYVMAARGPVVPVYLELIFGLFGVLGAISLTLVARNGFIGIEEAVWAVRDFKRDQRAGLIR
jgi:hypothetical protein